MDKVQRLILINQFKLLQKIDSNESDYYSQKIEILEEGYEYHYDEILGELSEPLPKEDSIFVLDILNMYRDINFSINSMDTEDKNIMSEITTYFKGFDFNDEYEVGLGIYARFFVEKKDRFKELVEDTKFESFNSHRPMKEIYENELRNYQSLKKNGNYSFGKLSTDQIQRIFRNGLA